MAEPHARRMLPQERGDSLRWLDGLLRRSEQIEVLQLAIVIRVCRDSRSLSDAGRRLFSVSRGRKASTNDADKLRKYLDQKGIETAIHYPTPIHLQKGYAQLGYKKGSFPVAEELSKTVLSLPIFVGLKESEIEKISSSIKNFFK